MEDGLKKQLKNYFYIFLGAFLGFLAALFFLHFIHYVSIRDISLMGGKIDLITFLRKTPVRQTQAMGIFLSFALLGAASGIIRILRQRINKEQKRIKILKEVSRAKTEFVAFAAHQLRTPLSGLRFSLKMFQSEDFGGLNKEQKKFAAGNVEALEALLTEVNNLLDISKIELRQIAVNKTSLSLQKFSTLVKELLQKYTPLAQKKNVLLDYSVPKKIPKISLEVDWEKISQVLENLLENALNYTPLGGKVFLKIQPKVNFLTVSISDTGIGIPLKEQKKVFTKFFRASNAKKVIGKGTGLGLYLAKFFIKSHQGKIWFKSQESQGTIFYFTLPYYQPKVATEKALERL